MISRQAISEPLSEKARLIRPLQVLFYMVIKFKCIVNFKSGHDAKGEVS